MAAAGRQACPQAAERIAREIETYGDIDRAAAALAHDEAQGLLAEILAYRTALAEQADPRRRIARLQQDAADLDARAEPLWAEAAEFAGRASFRGRQGEAELAALFQQKADVAERLAAELEAQAFAKRLEAARLMAGAGAGAAFQEILEALAA
jgi:hypothetical protein